MADAYILERVERNGRRTLLARGGKAVIEETVDSATGQGFDLTLNGTRVCENRPKSSIKKVLSG